MVITYTRYLPDVDMNILLTTLGYTLVLSPMIGMLSYVVEKIYCIHLFAADQPEDRDDTTRNHVERLELTKPRPPVQPEPTQENPRTAEAFASDPDLPTVKNLISCTAEPFRPEDLYM